MNVNPAQSPLRKPLASRRLDVCRKDTFFAGHGFSSVENVSPPGVPVRRGSPRAHASLCRTVPRPAVCAADLSGKPAPNRMPTCGASIRRRAIRRKESSAIRRWRCRSRCSWPSSRSVSTWKPRSTLCYRYFRSLFSRKFHETPAFSKPTTLQRTTCFLTN